MRVLIRCDATADTGFGHLSRCLGMAEALEDLDVNSVFLGRFDDDGCQLIAASGFDYTLTEHIAGSDEDLQGLLTSLRSARVHACLLDTYHLSEAYLDALYYKSVPTMVLDDFGQLTHYDCEVVINFTVDASNVPYKAKHSNTAFLLGSQYLIVRRRLRHLRVSAEARQFPPRKILIAIGGNDRYGLSLTLADAFLEMLKLQGYRAPQLRVVINQGNPHRQALIKKLNQIGSDSTLLSQQADLGDAYLWSDLCINGGGLTKYEAAYMGVPSVVLSQTNEQARETVQFASRGLALDMGLAKDATVPSLAQRLEDILNNSELLHSMSRQCLTFFPDDPTLQTAQACLTRLAATIGKK